MPKILVIEDDNDIRDVISEILSAENFEVVAAEDGHIGLLLAQEETPDLVLCDIMMPEFDGYSVMNQLHEKPHTQSIPFIFLTAKATKEDVRLGMELGADDYLMKPFTRDELLGTVTTQLEKKILAERKMEACHYPCLDVIRSLPEELDSPLSSILNLTSTLLETYETTTRDEVFKILNVIHRSGQNLHRQIQNIFLYKELACIETDSTRLRALSESREQCCTKSIITEISFQKAKQFDRTDDLQLDLQEVSVKISQPKIRKVVDEIIDNAFKFSSPGNSIQIHSEFVNDTFHLFVTDQGRGMLPDEVVRLSRYMNFEPTLYGKRQSKLGLIIAKQLIELHGGELKIESNPGQTCVHITLPGMSKVA